MAVPEEPQRAVSARRRLEELREQKAQTGSAESINRTRTVIIINLSIEILSGLIVFIGIVYIIRFFLLKRSDVDPLVFRLSAGCIAVFTFGWLTYLTIKIRRYVLQLLRTGGEKK